MAGVAKKPGVDSMLLDDEESEDAEHASDVAVPERRARRAVADWSDDDS
jgi:hypothetical protein